MTDKAYIVANEKQELDILKKLERKGVFWRVGRNAADFVPSENGVFNKLSSFPYAIIEKEFIVWSPIEQLADETIVYDGRKEEKMYKVTQEFMNDSIENHNRLIAIIKWLNGEDMFKVEEQHKFVVRSDKNYTDGTYAYVIVDKGISGTSYYDVSLATKFDTREEAQEWANSHQVVVEIDAEGNEVE